MVRNFIHLSLLRGINMLSPFVLYPYLVRTVGMDNFGHLTFAFAINAYVGMVGDYGFQQSAVREASAHRDDSQRLTNLYWTLLIAKPILILGTGLIAFLLCTSFLQDWKASFIACTGILIVLGDSMTPIWLFQGLEKMQNLVYSNLVTRILGLILVVVFVRAPEHYIYALPLMGISGIVAAIISNLILVPRTGLIQPYANAQIDFQSQMKAGYPFFLRSVAVSAYAQIPVFFLRSAAPPEILGHFGVADRIVGMLKAFLAAFSVAIFPPLVYKKSEGQATLVQFIQKYFRPYLLVVIGVSAILYVFAPEIIALYTGSDPTPIVPIMRAMAFLPLSIALSQPMDALMQVYGREKLIGYLMLAVGVLNLVLNAFLIPHYLAFGAALSLFITETVLVFLFLWFFEMKYRDEAYFLFQEKK